jgi:hypothetical protein
MSTDYQFPPRLWGRARAEPACDMDQSFDAVRPPSSELARPDGGRAVGRILGARSLLHSAGGRRAFRRTCEGRVMEPIWANAEPRMRWQPH